MEMIKAVHANIPAIIGQAELTMPSSSGTNGITVVAVVVPFGAIVVEVTLGAAVVELLPLSINNAAIVTFELLNVMIVATINDN